MLSCAPRGVAAPSLRVPRIGKSRLRELKPETPSTDKACNRLLRAARDAESSTSQKFHTLIKLVQDEHIEAANNYLSSEDARAALAQEITDECQQVIKLLEAAQTLGEVSTRSIDRVISAGEKLSCRFVAALLRDRGVDAAYVDVSEVIDFPVGEGLDQSFYDNLAARLGAKVNGCGAQVPVVTGYFGTVPGGLLDRVGRGYTDLCAALVAVGIAARELQVWKEVDGIFTADPRKVPTAKLLSSVTPAEASELTFYGSEVIHPFTMEQVIRARIPIRIKNVMNPRGNGTVILPDPLEDLKLASLNPLIRSRSSSTLSVADPSGPASPINSAPKRPTAVTIKHSIIVINVHSNKRSLSHGFFAKIFSTLDRWRLSIDLISTSEVHVSMALHSESPMLTTRAPTKDSSNGTGSGEEEDWKIIDRDLSGAIAELKQYGTVDIIPEMAILSLVGRQMKNMVGIAGRMFSTLGENNVNIEMISQGK